MKAKLKNANGAVRFLLNHGEKIGIAAVVVVAGLLVYKSLGREQLGPEMQADKLQTATQQAQQRVSEMTWDSLPDEEKTSSAVFLASSSEKIMAPVHPSDFPEIRNPNSPVIEEMRLRADPVLLEPTDLEANGDAGLWMAADPQVIRQKMIEARVEAAKLQKEQEAAAARALEESDQRGGGPGRGAFGGEGRGGAFGGERGYMGGDMGFSGTKTRDGAFVVPPQGGAQMQGFEDIREYHWVTVLAKVPIDAQFEMYEDALANTPGFSPQNDQPKYLGYFVQRAEVTAEGQSPWKTLPGVNDKNLVGVMTRWPIQTPELVTPKYVHPLLTFPLPPMVMREWDDRITHSDMPLQTPEEQAEEMMREAEEAAKQPEEKADDPENPFASVYERMTASSNQMMGGAYGREGGAFMRGPMGGEGGMMGRPMGRPGFGGEGGAFGRGGGMMGMGADLTSLPEKQWDGKTKHYLFRYFDSTVEPGRRYRYRVRLVFADVNALQTPRYLAQEVTTRLEEERKANKAKGNAANPNGFRMTEWSDPSPVAVVPESGRAFLAAVEPANNPLAEPEARVVVKALNAQYAAEAALSDTFIRGSVLNRNQQGQVIWSSLIKQDPNGEPIESPPFEFITGMTLLDFDGGDQVSKTRGVTAPGRALVMDAAGRIRLKEELEDQKQVRPFDTIIQASEEAARRQRSGDRGGRMGRD
jgi:hypothetical protein